MIVSTFEYGKTTSAIAVGSRTDPVADTQAVSILPCRRSASNATAMLLK
jgi:hypothetical protein